ncbi:MAG: hypothetical protein O7I93_18810 [Gemmatimonadetes bacterium]|nr:hypothetical protein [Gemmatimonadota bacterium]
MKRLSAIATVVVVAACNWGPSPTDAVDALIEAIAARDSVAIARHADIARVAESSVDPLIEAAAMMSELGMTGPGGQSGAMAVQMLEQFRPMLAPLMEQMFWQMLLDPESFRRGPFAGILGGETFAFDRISEAYRGVAYERKDENDRRIVGIDLSSEADSSNVVELVMERGEDTWQMVGFVDLAGKIEEMIETQR